VLHFHTLSNAAEAVAYFRAQDYHFEGAEQGAYVIGHGAELLGLDRSADPDQFARLLRNEHPISGAKLTNAQRPDRDIGRDMTVSIPKSVTLAAVLGGDDAAVHAVEQSIAELVVLVEKDVATRVRKKGADFDRPTGNLIAYVFPHQTTRPINGQPDPQLHWHVVIPNLTLDRQEGEWKAIQFRGLLRDSGYYNAVFRASLANRLQGIGYRVKRTKDAFEVVGVPDRAIKEFSRRTAQIEELAETLGVTRAETKAKLGATSREKKSKGLTWSDLMERWHSRLKPGELEAIQDAASHTVTPPDRSHESVDYALRHLLERKSVVPERQVVTEALKFGLGDVTPESVYREVAKLPLIRREMDGRVMVSTRGVLGEEKALIAWARDGRGKYRPLGRKEWLGASRNLPVSSMSGQFSNPYAVETARPNSSGRPSGFHGFDHPAPAGADTATPPAFGQPDRSVPSANTIALSPSQQSAIRHVLTSPDRVMLVRGFAGTGKTTMTRALLEQVQVPWVILAPSAEASRGVLRRDGFEEADTLAAFLLSNEMQQSVKGGLIVLDEASLAGAADLSKLSQAANSLNARVLLLGDRRQHKSVARGDVLALLEDKAGVPVATVSDVQRQRGRYKQAVELLAKGKVAEGFDLLDAMGWVKEPDHVGDVNKMVAADYLDALQKDKSVLVISPTHAEGEKVTAAIRERLKQEGVLHGEERTFERLVPLHLTEAERSDHPRVPDGTVAVFTRRSGAHRAGERVLASKLADGDRAAHAWAAYRSEEVRLAAGDAIRFTANGRDTSGKHRLNNGATYQIASFTKDGDIRLDNGWVVGKDFAHFQHGYAVTSHAAQGKTVDVVLIAQSTDSFPASNASQFYVSASRGRERTTIYTDSPEALREAIQRTDHRLLASDLVRAPRHGIRKRMKRHLGFLHRVAEATKQLVIGKEPALERQ